MSTRAIYIITNDTVLQLCYYKLQSDLKGIIDVIIIINKDYNQILQIIKQDIYKYYNICFLGWSCNCSLITQVAYNIDVFIKKKYIQALILLSPYDIDIFLLNIIKCKIIFIHGLKDNITTLQKTIKYYDNYKYAKQLFLLNNQNHNYTNENINDFIRNICI